MKYMKLLCAHLADLTLGVSSGLWLTRGQRGEAAWVFCPGHRHPVVAGMKGLLGGSVVKNLPDNAGDLRELGLIPRLGRSSGEGNSNPLRYSCLENPMHRGAWRATVHGVTKEPVTTKWPYNNNIVLMIKDNVPPLKSQTWKRYRQS